MSRRLDRGPDVAVANATSFRAHTQRRRLIRVPFHLIEPAALFGDLFVIVLSGLLADLGYHWFFLSSKGDITDFLAVDILVFANFFALTSAQQNYRPSNLINVGRQFRYVTLNWLFIFFILVAVAFTLKISEEFSRGSALSFLVIGWVGLLGYRTALGNYLKRAMAEGAFAQQKVILISQRGQQATSRALSELRQCGYQPIRTFELTQAEFDATGITKSLKQKTEEIIATGRDESVDYIFLLLKWDHRQLINSIVGMLRALPIPVYLLPDENVATFLSARSGHIGKTVTVELQRAPLTKLEQTLKRAFDIVAASGLLVVLSPLMLITALMIKLDSPGPVLFKQKRNGFNGKVFTIYKFRSMRVLEDGKCIQQAKRRDPRVTRIGRWLRSTSIDELPQLFNVVSGDMSLVGPRPHAVAHNDEYRDIVSNYAFRHHVKPGITGWAQVNGLRGETQTTDLMTRRVEHDLWYINHWSIWLDLRILLKTILQTYRQPMAY
jgi:Undecaprenyl-phosphate glucose phosphotransferase